MFVYNLKETNEIFFYYEEVLGEPTYMHRVWKINIRNGEVSYY